MVATYLSTLHRFSRPVWLYLLVNALLGFSYYGIYTVLLNLYILRLGFGPEFVGLVNAAGNASLAVFSLPAAGMGIRWGNQRMIAAGIGLMAVSLCALPLADVIVPAWQAPWILVMYVLAFWGTALFLVNTTPFLMHMTSVEERNHAFSLQGATNPLAGFAGAFLGGILPGLVSVALGVSVDHPAPFRYPLLLAGLMLLPGMWLLRRGATPESGSAVDAGPQPEDESIAVSAPLDPVSPSESPPYGIIIVLFLAVVLRVAGSGAAFTFFNVYMDTGLHAPTALIGTVLALSQLLSVPAALAAPLLMNRWPKVHIYAVGSLVVGFCLLPLALVPQWGAAAFSVMSISFIVSLANPALNVYQMEVVSPRWRAAISGAFNMAYGISWGGISLGGGFIITNLGFKTLFLLGFTLTMSGTLLFWSYFRGKQAPARDSVER
ncbi:MAG: MFS transporter [Chloroflexi bacterium]|nr:MFS transporter [Chloroflexota bacterium]